MNFVSYMSFGVESTPLFEEPHSVACSSFVGTCLLYDPFVTWLFLLIFVVPSKESCGSWLNLSSREILAYSGSFFHSPFASRSTIRSFLPPLLNSSVVFPFLEIFNRISSLNSLNRSHSPCWTSKTQNVEPFWGSSSSSSCWDSSSSSVEGELCWSGQRFPLAWWPTAPQSAHLCLLLELMRGETSDWRVDVEVAFLSHDLLHCYCGDSLHPSRRSSPRICQSKWYHVKEKTLIIDPLFGWKSRKHRCYSECLNGKIWLTCCSEIGFFVRTIFSSSS